MEDTAIPYELPEAENHSFFFIDQRVEPSLEAKLHHHDAWELYYVVHGRGNRMAGDTLQPFAAGDVATAIEQTWKAAQTQIKNVVNNVVFPVVDMILAILFFVKLGTAYFDYRRHGQFEFAAPAILFACLLFTLTAPLYIWTIL